MNYKQRMLMELLQLRERIVKMDCFNKQIMTERDLNLLERQRKAMDEYANALEGRMLICLEDNVEAVTTKTTTGFKLNE